MILLVIFNIEIRWTSKLYRLELCFRIQYRWLWLYSDSWLNLRKSWSFISKLKIHPFPIYPFPTIPSIFNLQISLLVILLEWNGKKWYLPNEEMWKSMMDCYWVEASSETITLDTQINKWDSPIPPNTKHLRVLSHAEIINFQACYFYMYRENVIFQHLSQNLRRVVSQIILEICHKLF